MKLHQIKRHSIADYEYFAGEDNDDDSIVSNPSTFCPPAGRDKHLDEFIDYVNNIPIGQHNRRKIRHNLNKQERDAMKKLRSRTDIIIKEADKGSAVVIMDKDYYKNKITNILNDEITYTEIKDNQDKKITGKVAKLLRNSTANVTEKESDYLTKFETKTSQFYGLPKIHKSQQIKDAVTQQNSMCVNLKCPEDLTFRPIVAGPACPTHRLSDLTDKLLRPFIKHVPSYVRDDLDFLNHLPETIEENEILISLDICSLYSNIDHDLGKTAIKYWLDTHPDDIHERFTAKFILESIDIILKNNTFQFGNRHFIQRNGTAMGTKFAPTYATLVLGYLEIQLYDRINISYGPEAKDIFKKILKRYLDDVFMILNTQMFNIQEIVSVMNGLHESINFTYETSNSQLPFLDILIIKNGNQIVTDIYHKPTDTKQYLTYKSCHPRSTKNNVPYNLARRVCTIITNDSLRNKRLIELKDSLLARDYPESVIDNGIEMASKLDITELRTPKEQETEAIIPFVTTYNPKTTNIFSEIKGHLGHLNKSVAMREALTGVKFIKSNRQGPNLKKLLTRAAFHEDYKNTGWAKKCNSPRCKCCIDITETSSFVFHETGDTFNIKCTMTCDSENLIYVLQCCGCNKYYIGQTGDKLRARCRVHRQGVTNNTSIAVDLHIHKCAKHLTRKFTIIPFYKMQSSSKEDRLQKESYFIHKFKPLLNQ